MNKNNEVFRIKKNNFGNRIINLRIKKLFLKNLIEIISNNKKIFCQKLNSLYWEFKSN